MKLSHGDMMLQTDDLLDEAIEQVSKRLSGEQANLVLRRRLAKLLRQRGHLDTAASQYRAIWQQDPGDDEAKYLASALSPEGETVALPQSTSTVLYRGENFLDEAELARLWLTVEQQLAEFTPSVIGDGELASDYRDSSKLTVNELPQLTEWFLEKVLEKLDACWPSIRRERPVIGGKELQLTRHRDGQFYKLHKDSADQGPDASRGITYVYYFFREPKTFTGGDLLLLDDHQGREIVTTYTRIEPGHNTILFFPSDRYHQVEPVGGAAGDPTAGRFTVNGWLHVL